MIHNIQPYRTCLICKNSYLNTPILKILIYICLKNFCSTTTKRLRKYSTISPHWYSTVCQTLSDAFLPKVLSFTMIGTNPKLNIRDYSSQDSSKTFLTISVLVSISKELFETGGYSLQSLERFHQYSTSCCCSSYPSMGSYWFLSLF